MSTIFILSVLTSALLIVSSKAATFGFVSCSTEFNQHSASGEVITVTYFEDNKRYQCEVQGQGGATVPEIVYECTIDQTNECIETGGKYGIEIGIVPDPIKIANAGEMDDVCVSQIIVDGVFVAADRLFVGDGAGDVFKYYKFYDLGTYGTALPTSVTGVIVDDLSVCSPAECGGNLIYDAAIGQCVRDCSTFAINEYLGCSTTYNTDKDTIGTLIDGLRSDVTVVETTVNSDFGPRIAVNEGSITQIVGTTIPDLESNFEPRVTANTDNIAQIVGVTIPGLQNNFDPRITQNTGDIAQIMGFTIPDLESRLDPRITTNTDDIAQITGVTIPDLEARLDPRITTNTGDIAQIVSVTIPDLENNFGPRITANTGDISQIVSFTIPDLETSLDTRISALETTVNIDYAPRISDNEADIIAMRDTTIPSVVNTLGTVETELRALIQSNEDEIEALRPVSAASAGMNGFGSVNGYDSHAQDWMIFSVLVANVGLMSCSVLLCAKLRKQRAYAKIANYAQSESE